MDVSRCSWNDTRDREAWTEESSSGHDVRIVRSISTRHGVFANVKLLDKGNIKENEYQVLKAMEPFIDRHGAAKSSSTSPRYSRARVKFAVLLLDAQCIQSSAHPEENFAAVGPLHSLE